uniref:Signal recognition particle receptor subunit beta n=1 Tax=Orthoderella ornata TaxID=444751 RepID=A0A481SXD2_9NEOP|nr:putative ARL3 [Orthoderella ornata]
MEDVLKKHGEMRSNSDTFSYEDLLEDRETLAIIISSLVVLITVVLYFILQRKKHARRSILITGLTDSGKTLLYARLLSGKFKLTHTSVKENAGDLHLKKGTVKVVDIPGHERLRGKFFDNYKQTARGIIYVIDSVTFQKDIRDVAEYLYIILSDDVINSNRPSVLILCNKQDETMAKGCKVIQAMLEKEITTLRVTKSSQLESTNETGKQISFLGKEEKDFEFSQLSHLKITFAESSGRSSNNENECDLESVHTWLEEVA